MNKTIKIFTCLLILILCSACPSGGSNSDASCDNEDNLATENTCLTATVLEQGFPFPSPVQTGGTLKLKMKIGAVDAQFNTLSATISTKVFSINGQLVAQHNAGTFQSNANYQDIPVWTNINAASGQYFIEVTVGFGACGSKTICLSDKRFNVFHD